LIRSRFSSWKKALIHGYAVTVSQTANTAHQVIGLQEALLVSIAELATPSTSMKAVRTSITDL